MTETVKRSGSCGCGAVSVLAHRASTKLGACHCRACRRWGGGPLMTISCGTEVEFSGSDHIGVFNSSEWAERGFCQLCGSHLFYRLKQTGQHEMPAGLFDDTDDLQFDHEVFVDERPSYYHFGNQTEEMTGAECFAKFAPPSAC